MGAFNTIVFRCPECLRLLEEQTDCGLYKHADSVWQQDLVPSDAAKEFIEWDEGIVNCFDCKKAFRTIILGEVAAVRLSLIPYVSTPTE